LLNINTVRSPKGVNLAKKFLAVFQLNSAWFDLVNKYHKKSISMKKTILFALICAGLLTSCNKDEAEPEIRFDSAPSSVAYRQEKVVNASGNDLNINLQEIVDSRCPSNVVCVTMGSAELTFEISNSIDNVVVRASFSADQKKSEIHTFTLAKQNYALKVTEVLPYPETSKTPTLSEYKVGVSIVKL
jgi:hypothetical protein